MEEKTIVTNLLTLIKGLCTTAYFGTIESNEVDFESNLKSYIKIQREIYQYMKDNNLYKVEFVEKTKLNKAKEEYCF